MNNTVPENDLELLDPFSARKLKHDFDKHEIRGKDKLAIEDWIRETLFREQLIGLLRTGFIEVIGVGKESSPVFRQAEFIEKGSL